MKKESKEKNQKKTMKKKEKRMILILSIITIIVIIIAIAVKNKNSKNETVEKNNNNNNTVVQTEEEFVEVLDDGTRLNTSNKLQETKTIDGMEVKDFQLTEKDNVTVLLGTVTNTSNTTKGDYPVDVKIVDKEGKEIVTIAAYIGKLEPGESTQFNTSATFNYANAYDFSITKK